MDTSKVHPSWAPLFEAQKVRLGKIDRKLKAIRDEGATIYPKEADIFRVFEMDATKVKVLILGQDPYISPNQAMGLSFSVPATTSAIPPSLQNIFKELKDEYPNAYTFKHGDLTRWFEAEHICLLNASLTVTAGKSGSHMAMWQRFTDNAIRFIANVRPDTVFLLMGSYAKSKIDVLPQECRANVVACVHPSPLSAYHGFFKSDVFRKVNQKLEVRGTSPVCWQN